MKLKNLDFHSPIGALIQ